MKQHCATCQCIPPAYRWRRRRYSTGRTQRYWHAMCQVPPEDFADYDPDGYGVVWGHTQCGSHIWRSEDFIWTDEETPSDACPKCIDRLRIGRCDHYTLRHVR